MFKWIKRVIKLALLLIVLTPVIVLVVMYKGYSAPVDDFSANEGLSFNDIASNKLDEFIADENALSFDFVLTSSEANAALKDIYAAENPDFGKTDETIDLNARKYAIAFGNNNGGFKGVTLAFNETGLTIEAGLDAGFSNIYYQTTLYLDLDINIEQVEVDNELITQYKLTIKEIKFGNMPILWMYDAADFIVSRFTEDGLNGLIQNAVSGFGNYDLKTKSIWVNTKDLINLISKEDDPNRLMIEALLGFVDEEELLVSGFGEDVGGIGIALGKMRSTETPYQTTNQISDETELNNMFESQLTTLLLSSITGGSSLNYDMHEETFNQLIEYYVGESMDMSQTFEFDENIYVLETLPLYARFIDNRVHFTIIMKLYNQTDPSKVFQTDFTLVSIPSISDDKQDLVFTIDVIHIGDDTTVTNNKVATILNLVGENEMIVGNQIILKDFMGNFAGQSTTVDSVAVSGKYLRFVVTPTGANAAILAELQDAIDAALTTILLNPDYAALEDVYTNDPTDTEGLLDALNTLTPQEQQAFYNSLYLTLGTSVDVDSLLP
ncbi:hypothetical protein [Acholeplasma laidlawii]|jgi:hypothetical protein|uniref:Uncharacterized protein n=4 Tax=Acholeplasma laidlawii TaxID=2148 RepID=A0A553IGI5_ACHLA|nr:hypothetical protein [Acholeplasma laidlawii]ABX81945.1 hypothetical surface-anchored protein [Acholeplasma laidlawii PG-8A]NWH10927.1 hypothetical protein [Acholeplasma laidlawii]NWH12313.1 hypothetical protein [Acholeplasma laidlawii]NWH13699.1 hypothetical protein [Acholeplasma laidlawii]NWH15056.1 hypothetical protein [Acholeplasma laidlawii]